MLCCGLLFVAFPAQAQTLRDFTDLIENHSPAVVKITVRGSAGGPEPRYMPDEQIPERFGDFFERYNPPERDFQSMGSGVIVSEVGDVLTNNDEVDRAEEVVVRLLDGRESQAEVERSEELTYEL